MAERFVPAWCAAVGIVEAETERVYDAFRDVLHDLPMSYADLARRIGVSQPAISRWANGDTHPSLQCMVAVLGAVKDRLAEIQQTTERADDVIGLVTAAVDIGDDPNQGTEDLLDLRRKLRAVLSDPSRCREAS